MGFVKKIISPAAPQSATSVYTPPPVVADTADTDSAAAYEQKSARKKGLLSTLLSKQNQRGTSTTGNTTLG